MTIGGADRLLQEVRQELATMESRNHFVELVAEGSAPRERLAALACEELLIVPSDRRGFAFLAARFPEAPAGELFLSLAQGEGMALSHLGAFARALGLDASTISSYELLLRAQGGLSGVRGLRGMARPQRGPEPGGRGAAPQARSVGFVL